MGGKGQETAVPRSFRRFYLCRITHRDAHPCPPGDYDPGDLVPLRTQPYSLGIQELQTWSLTSAWEDSNIFLLLMAGGFVLLASHLRRERRREGLFIAVWAAFLVILTIFHSTFEYYLAVPLILLSAFCIVETLRYGSGELKAGIPSASRGCSPDPRQGNPTGIPVHPGSTRRGRRKRHRIPRGLERMARVTTGHVSLQYWRSLFSSSSLPVRSYPWCRRSSTE